MPVTLNVTADTSDLVLAELRRMFGGAVFSDTPALAEKRAEVAAAAEAEPSEEKKRTRRTKAEMEAARAAEIAAATPVETPKIDLEEAIAATKAETPKATEVPTIDDLRAALKRLGAADGFGHDAVIKLLDDLKAKNASSIPEDQRAGVIARVGEMLGAKS